MYQYPIETQIIVLNDGLIIREIFANNVAADNSC